VGVLYGMPLQQDSTFDTEDAFVVEVTDELPSLTMAKITLAPG
jgi:hypothetical protein